MSAIRSAHPPEQDVLRGLTLEDAREAAARLALRAEILTAHLRFYPYAPGSVVKANLEQERNGLEMAAADLQSRIAEATGQITQVHGAAVRQVWCRRCGARNVQAESLPACRLCGAEIRASEQRRAR